MKPYKKFSDIVPPNFRSEDINNIHSLATKGKCIQLVGLPGFGKTTFLEFLMNHTKFKSNKPFYVNCYDHRVENSDLLVDKIKNQINAGSRIIIFDSFDRLVRYNDQYLFSALNQARYNNYSSLSYIFSVDREIVDISLLKELKPITTIIAENIYFLTPLNEKDGHWYCEYTTKRLGLKVNKETVETIYKMSGGIMRLITRLAKAIQDGYTLESINNNPKLYFPLQIDIESVIEKLRFEEREVLIKLALNKRVDKSETQLRKLVQLGLLDENYNFTVTLLGQYLKVQSGLLAEKTLTSSEDKLFKHLLKHEGEISSREDVIKAIWGDNASWEISDHALDQLIHRLKIKLSINPNFNLTTIRGRGVKIEKS